MKKATFASSGITVRRMDFDFAGVPRYWVDNTPFLTHMLNALSATFPVGERFFVESVRHYRDRISDPQLKKEVSAFIGQEAMHAKEHDSYNQYARAHGIDLERIEKEIAGRIAFLQKNATPEHQLAVTCALEHFTAIMAEGFLDNPEMFEKMDPAMVKLWLWHAVEENEHKGVAFDVYQEQVGDYWLRVRVMALTTVMFTVNQARFQARLLREDGELKPAAWLKGMNRLWGRRGWFRQMIPAYFEYYRPDFHPWQSDTRALLDHWKRELQLDEQAVHHKGKAAA
ncbi:MAG: metal-dependent hydrolase [Moraxellaceae bacterium]|nr:metal-dependent hydrolase [Moraxellaceae bacterium]